MLKKILKGKTPLFTLKDIDSALKIWTWLRLSVQFAYNEKFLLYYWLIHRIHIVLLILMERRIIGN